MRGWHFPCVLLATVMDGVFQSPAIRFGSSGACGHDVPTKCSSSSIRIEGSSFLVVPREGVQVNRIFGSVNLNPRSCLWIRIF